jgi:hypothetical protein
MRCCDACGLGQIAQRRNVIAGVGRNVIAGVVGLVLADRDSSSRSFGFLLEHRLGGAPLRRAVGRRDGAANRKAVAVLYDRMTHITELGLESFSLTVKLGLGVARIGACRSCASGRESLSRRRYPSRLWA